MTKKSNKKVVQKETVEVEIVPPKLTLKEKTALRIEIAKTKVTKEQQETVEKLPSKSAKIRYLNTQDYTTGEIRDILGIIYQHVYNVLHTPLMADIKAERAEQS